MATRDSLPQSNQIYACNPKKEDGCPEYGRTQLNRQKSAMHSRLSRLAGESLEPSSTRRGPCSNTSALPEATSNGAPSFLEANPERVIELPGAHIAATGHGRTPIPPKNRLCLTRESAPHRGSAERRGESKASRHVLTRATTPEAKSSGLFGNGQPVLISRRNSLTIPRLLSLLRIF
jgi:hypothetical protein